MDETKGITKINHNILVKANVIKSCIDILINLQLGGIHKLRLQEEGGRWSKKLTFCKLLYHRKCKRRGVGGQKKPNLVNIVCECPLTACPYRGLPPDLSTALRAVEPGGPGGPIETIK